MKMRVTESISSDQTLSKKREMIITRFDRRTLLFIQKFRPNYLRRFFILLTYTGTSRGWLVMASILSVLHFSGVRFIPDQAAFLKALLAPLLAWSIGLVVKKAVSRKRPLVGTDGLLPLIATPTCGSFPSNHTASTFAFFCALLMIGHPLAIWVGLWASVVSFSRLYLGVHYLTDVLGGALIGACSGTAFVLLMQRLAL